MKTATDVIRARVLLQTLDDVNDLRETLAKDQGAFFGFGEVELSDDSHFDNANGYGGTTRMPRDVASKLIDWLEVTAREELEKIGVKV